VLAGLLIALTCLAVGVATVATRRLRSVRRRCAAMADEAARAVATAPGAERAAVDALLAAAPTPVIRFGADGAVIARNPASLVAFGGGPPPPELVAAVTAVLTGEAALDTEITITEPVRRRFETHVRRNDGGALALLADATGAGDFREARRLFSAAVSHELRTPLARILGLVETISLTTRESEREELIALTEVEIDNMRRLIDDMLLLAALDGGVAGGGETADAGAAAEAVVGDRLARRSGRGRDLRAEAARGLRVAVPRRLLETVVGNLVDNALRHAGPQAAVRVDVAPVGDGVEIVVSDDGVGISPEHLPHVFERFYRAEASRVGPGTGLGLAVVKHIVEAHGGRVAATSLAGEGTSVRLVLPRSA
jgi:signal transduction histidine kinase